METIMQIHLLLKWHKNTTFSTQLKLNFKDTLYESREVKLQDLSFQIHPPSRQGSISNFA